MKIKDACFLKQTLQKYLGEVNFEEYGAKSISTEGKKNQHTKKPQKPKLQQNYQASPTH